MTVAVLSRARASWLKQHPRCSTLHNLRGSGADVVLFVRGDDPEVTSYRRLAEEEQANLVLYDAEAESATCWPGVMNYIVRHFADRVKLAVMDDDVAMSGWDPAEPVSERLVHFDSLLIKWLLDAVLRTVVSEACPVATFPPVYSRTHHFAVSFCNPMQLVTLMHVPTLLRQPYDVTMRAYSDFQMALRLLTQGCLTASVSVACLNSKFNTPGGSSTYRTAKVQDEAAHRLRDEFPGIVTLKEQDREWRDGLCASIKVQWKKAFREEQFNARFGERAIDHKRRCLSAFEAAWGEIVTACRTSRLAADYRR